MHPQSIMAAVDVQHLLQKSMMKGRLIIITVNISDCQSFIFENRKH